MAVECTPLRELSLPQEPLAILQLRLLPSVVQEVCTLGCLKINLALKPKIEVSTSTCPVVVYNRCDTKESRLKGFAKTLLLGQNTTY